MFCPYCGSINYDESSFCQNCGKSFSDLKALEKSIEQTKNPYPNFNHDASLHNIRSENEGNSTKLDNDQIKNKAAWPYFLVSGIALALAIFLCIFHFLIRPGDAGNQTVSFETHVEEIAVQKNKEEKLSEIATEETTAVTQFPAIMYTTAHDGLLLRQGPGKEYSPIYLIPYGTQVSVQKIENNWAYTTIAGFTGWCSCDYLKDNAK